jgi:hypothetical protein
VRAFELPIRGLPLDERDDFGAQIGSPTDLRLGMVHSIALLEPESSRRLASHRGFSPANQRLRGVLRRLALEEGTFRA